MTDALARASFELLAFIELSDDRTIEPDDAVRAMEEFYGALRGCTSAELLSYAAVVDALAAEAVLDPTHAGKLERAEFFRATAADLRNRAAHTP